jgi:hypothetical protein
VRGRFNYLLFFIRIIFCLAFATLGVWGIIDVIIQWVDAGIFNADQGKLVIFCIAFCYIAVKLGQAAWHQRFTIRLSGDKIIVRDVFLFRRRVLQLSDIKGFSLMEYPTRWVKGRSIMLYLTEEQKLEFPEFLFLNFRKLDKALEESGLHFFGVESRRWRRKKLE